MAASAFNLGGGCKYRKILMASSDGLSDMTITADDNYKLVVIAGTKKDGNSMDISTIGVSSGSATMEYSNIYRTNADSTGFCAVFSNVKSGAVLAVGHVNYGAGYVTAMCFK